MGPVYCAVVGCKNSSYKLDKWKILKCKTHPGKLKQSCQCERPFQLYCFPGEKRYKDKRDKWARLLKRKNFDSTEWIPSKNHRVCSEHFVDGIPTVANPDPTLKLGYADATKDNKELPSLRPSMALRPPPSTSKPPPNSKPPKIILYKLNVVPPPNKNIIRRTANKNIEIRPKPSSSLPPIVLTPAFASISGQSKTVEKETLLPKESKMPFFGEHNYCIPTMNRNCKSCKDKDIMIKSLNLKIASLTAENKKWKEKVCRKRKNTYFSKSPLQTKLMKK